MTTDSYTINTYIGVRIADRQTLIDFADQYVRPDAPFLHITLPCGNVREYLIPEHVPTHSIECRCGELKYPHFFILYDEVPQ